MSRLALVAVDVRSTYNVGSLFRTCDGFGAELILVGICPRPIHLKDDRLPHISQKADKEIAKTALGAEKTVKWRYFKDFEECVSLLKKEGFFVAAIEQANDSAEIRFLSSKKDTALVVGREVEGLYSEELALCDKTYEITMQGSKESFNVSVAAGIALYQASLLRD